MVEIIMLIGPSGSGKSTFSKRFDDFKCVSSDEIREELYGDAAVQKNPARIFKIAHERIQNYLANGESVVFDATNLEKKFRKEFLNKFGDIAFCTAIYFKTPKETCIARQAFRERKVPVHVIEKQFENFDYPTYDEGWYSIRVIE